MPHPDAVTVNLAQCTACDAQPASLAEADVCKNDTQLILGQLEEICIVYGRWRSVCVWSEGEFGQAGTWAGGHLEKWSTGRGGSWEQERGEEVKWGGKSKITGAE